MMCCTNIWENWQCFFFYSKGATFCTLLSWNICFVHIDLPYDDLWPMLLFTTASLLLMKPLFQWINVYALVQMCMLKASVYTVAVREKSNLNQERQQHCYCLHFPPCQKQHFTELQLTKPCLVSKNNNCMTPCSKNSKEILFNITVTCWSDACVCSDLLKRK